MSSGVSPPQTCRAVSTKACPILLPNHPSDIAPDKLGQSSRRFAQPHRAFAAWARAVRRCFLPIHPTSPPCASRAPAPLLPDLAVLCDPPPCRKVPSHRENAKPTSTCHRAPPCCPRVPSKLGRASEFLL